MNQIIVWKDTWLKLWWTYSSMKSLYTVCCFMSSHTCYLPALAFVLIGFRLLIIACNGPCSGGVLQVLKENSQGNLFARVWWFRMFQHFEHNVQGTVPKNYQLPLSWRTLPWTRVKYSRLDSQWPRSCDWGGTVQGDLAKALLSRLAYLQIGSALWLPVISTNCNVAFGFLEDTVIFLDWHV